jgi:hypothetical protein
MSMVVFGVVTLCGLVGRTTVSEEHTVFIFSAQDGGNRLLRNVGRTQKTIVDMSESGQQLVKRVC